MEVQPQLVLLQKTLLNIEGLGRQLYPELDLWVTAYPFLENWMKQRMALPGVWKQIKQHIPDWLEQGTEFPQLLFDAAQQIKHLDQITSQLPLPKNLPTNQKPYSKKRHYPLLALVSFSAALLIASPSLQQWLVMLPKESYLLAGLGILLLWNR